MSAEDYYLQHNEEAATGSCFQRYYRRGNMYLVEYFSLYLEDTIKKYCPLKERLKFLVYNGFYYLCAF